MREAAKAPKAGGLYWFNSYIDSLDEEQRKKVKLLKAILVSNLVMADKWTLENVQEFQLRLWIKVV